MFSKCPERWNLSDVYVEWFNVQGQEASCPHPKDQRFNYYVVDLWDGSFYTRRPIICFKLTFFGLIFFCKNNFRRVLQMLMTVRDSCPSDIFQWMNHLRPCQLGGKRKIKKENTKTKVKINFVLIHDRDITGFQKTYLQLGYCFGIKKQITNFPCYFMCFFVFEYITKKNA